MAYGSNDFGKLITCDRVIVNPKLPVCIRNIKVGCLYYTIGKLISHAIWENIITGAFGTRVMISHITPIGLLIILQHSIV